MGAIFSFQPILADFHEYTFNMTSYQVIEQLIELKFKNSYIRNTRAKFG